MCFSNLLQVKVSKNSLLLYNSALGSVGLALFLAFVKVGPVFIGIRRKEKEKTAA